MITIHLQIEEDYIDTFMMTLPKDKVIESINLISAVSNEIKITFTNKNIIFESLSSENSEAKTELDYVCNLDNFTIAINSRHMMDFLKEIENNEFTLGINEQNLPFVLKNANLATIIMPIAL